ncbi:MAG: VWA domain-containing protein [Betaproteobacteria bacterium]
MRPLLAAALAAALATPAATSDRIVHVDVFATDARGRFVTGLTAADFDLRENGVLQRIDSVTLVRPGERADASLPQAPADRQPILDGGGRAFGLLLDDFHLTPDGASRARELLASFAAHDLGPRDLVAVMKPLDSLLAIRATRDRDALQAALSGLQGREGDYEPRSAFERNYIAGDHARIDAARAQVTLSALNALVVHLGRLGNGRKTLLFVSEGLSAPPRRRGFEPMATLDTVLRSANRYDVAIYAIDPGAGLEDVPPMLQRLAADTDGAAIGREADASDRLARTIADASTYYLVSYRSVQPADGMFRGVQVGVKRKGVRVRARKGYWALFPDELLAETIAAGGAATKPALPREFNMPWRASPLIRPWFGIARGQGNTTRVTFVWEPAPRVPGDRSRRPTPSRVQLKALAPDGTIAFDGFVNPADDAVAGRDVEEQAARAVFDVPPGPLRLHMAIEDAAAGTIDTDVREIAVRELKSPVALGTPQVFRARTAPELRTIAADPDAVPVASRDFNRTETVLIRCAAYAPGGSPRVTARLLSRFGQQIRALPVSAAPERALQIEIPLAPFAPGDYVVEVTASSPAGVARELVDFRVRG